MQSSNVSSGSLQTDSFPTPLTQKQAPNAEYATETREELMYNKEKLLANGDKWEPEMAAAARADAPYR